MLSKRVAPKTQKHIQTLLSEMRSVTLADKLCPAAAFKKPALHLFPERRTVDFKELSERSSSIARVLHSLGVKKGDRVCAELPKSVELMATVVGCAQLGAVYVPLHTAFNSESALLRIDDCDPKVVISDAANRFKLDGAAKTGRIMATINPTPRQLQAGDISLLSDGGITVTPPKEMLKEDDLMAIVYTSGTTGHPKGVEVPVKALAAFKAYMDLGIDLKPEDSFFCAAHPSRGVGLFHGVYGSLLKEQCNVFSGPEFNPHEIADILEQRKVTNLLAPSTWFRDLRASGVLDERKKLGKLNVPLKKATSRGEPLMPATSEWFGELFPTLKEGRIIDHYGRVEHGIISANCLHEDEKLEVVKCDKTSRLSVGVDHPGFALKIVDPKTHSEVKKGEIGELAVVKSESPLFWFRGHWSKKKQLDKDLFLTGDLAKVEKEQIFLQGRKDDMIMSSGKKIAPIEVEVGLDRHPAVAEVAVIGVPDENVVEKVKAFVVLRKGHNPSDFLAKEIAELGKKFALHMPHEIEFIAELPRTKTNKIQRFALRAREAEMLRLSQAAETRQKLSNYKL